MRVEAVHDDHARRAAGVQRELAEERRAVRRRELHRRNHGGHAGASGLPGIEPHV